jgi:hypothetical protein
LKWFLVFVIVACTVASDVLQAYEMKRHGEISDFRARSLARALGILAKRRFQILSIFLHGACLSLRFSGCWKLPH